MYLKKSFLTLLTMGSLMLPCMLSAGDFEWQVNLNLYSQSDPYAYRHGLANRFNVMEEDVVLILDRVYEPSDAYMIYRLAELSGRSPEYILGVYYSRRHYGWEDMAVYLGIRPQVQEFVILRERHDMRDIYYDYNYRRKERYEERYYPRSRVVEHRPPSHYRHVPPPRHEPPRIGHKEDYRPSREHHAQQQEHRPQHHPPRQEMPHAEQQQRPSKPAQREQVQQIFLDQNKAEVRQPNNRLDQIRSKRYDRGDR